MGAGSYLADPTSPRMTESQTKHIFFNPDITLLSLVLGEIQTHNLLIFGQTPTLSCLGAWARRNAMPPLDQYSTMCVIWCYHS